MRVHRIQRRLGMPDSELGWCYQPPRPKGMHRVTYERLKGRIFCEQISIERLFAVSAGRLLERLDQYDRRHGKVDP